LLVSRVAIVLPCYRDSRMHALAGPWRPAPVRKCRSSLFSQLFSARRGRASGSASTQAEAAVGVFHGAREAPCSFPMHRHRTAGILLVASHGATTTTFSSLYTPQGARQLGSA
jgi:hypothetical protein